MSRKRPGFCHVAFGILLLIGLPLGAPGQTESASIHGFVTDPSGASVAGATVRLTDVDHGTAIEAPTGSNGFYTFANVYPGNYRMDVEASRFKQVRLTGITVNELDNLERNLRLEVGPVSESVTVEADASHVDIADGTVSTVVDRQAIDNLPLNGRSFQTLIMLTPGVVVTSTTFDDQGQFTAAQKNCSPLLASHGRAVRSRLSRCPPWRIAEGADGGVICAMLSGGTEFNHSISTGVSNAAPSSERWMPSAARIRVVLPSGADSSSRNPPDASPIYGCGFHHVACGFRLMTVYAIRLISAILRL